MGFQDASDFNVATSSLHALSNSMTLTRNDKQSPHSSPRMTRRSATPNMQTPVTLSQTTTNDIYASQLQQQQQPPQSQPPSQQQQQPQQIQSNTKMVEYFHGCTNSKKKKKHFR